MRPTLIVCKGRCRTPPPLDPESWDGRLAYARYAGLIAALILLSVAGLIGILVLLAVGGLIGWRVWRKRQLTSA